MSPRIKPVFHLDCRGSLARDWGKRDWLEHDPDYDILRDDPRFQKLMAKLK